MYILVTKHHMYLIRPCLDGSSDKEILMDSKLLGKIITISSYQVGVRLLVKYATGPNLLCDWEFIITEEIIDIK